MSEWNKRQLFNKTQAIQNGSHKWQPYGAGPNMVLSLDEV